MWRMDGVGIGGVAGRSFDGIAGGVVAGVLPDAVGVVEGELEGAECSVVGAAVVVVSAKQKFCVDRATGPCVSSYRAIAPTSCCCVHFAM